MSVIKLLEDITNSYLQVLAEGGIQLALEGYKIHSVCCLTYSFFPLPPSLFAFSVLSLPEEWKLWGIRCRSWILDSFDSMPNSKIDNNKNTKMSIDSKAT